MLGVASRSDMLKQHATIDIDLKIYNQQILGLVLSTLNPLPNVIEVSRVHEH